MSDGNGNGKLLHEWVVWNPMGGVHTGGGSNSNDNGIIMEWVGYPFVTATAKANWGGVNIYMYRMMPLPLPSPLMPPSVNTCNDSVAVAVTQCERTFKRLQSEQRISRNTMDY